MNFSQEYLYENFKKEYDKAIEAKQRGNLAVMKQSLEAAAGFLEMLGQTLPAAEGSEKKTQAARMRAIADSIVIPIRSATVPSTPKKGVGNKTTGAGMGSSTPDPTAQSGLSEAETSSFFTFFKPDELSMGFEDVIGLDEAKAAVKEYVINPLLYPEAYSYTFIENKGILLEGPPGTGKTSFAKAVAKEIRQPFALINVAGLVNCYVGETGKNIDKVFAFLREYTQKRNCGITVFFDELDEIAKRRGGEDKASETAVPALLRNLDGVKENKGFLILANTNHKEMLDRAILDRFRKSIYIPLPDKAAREKLFRLKLKDVEAEYIAQVDFVRAAVHSEGMSGRQITYVCDDLKYRLSKAKAGLQPLEGTDALNVALEKLIETRRNSTCE